MQSNTTPAVSRCRARSQVRFELYCIINDRRRRRTSPGDSRAARCASQVSSFNSQSCFPPVFADFESCHQARELPENQTCDTSVLLKCSEQFEGQLDFDLGNLAAYDPSPVDTEQFASDPDAACLTVASKITQALVAQLFALPSEAADVGRVAQLPPPTTALPRAKPIPKPREPTKWEKFAQQKGITKHKRSREVWDEETQDFKRRFGFKGVNDDQPAIMDAKPSDQVSVQANMLCLPLRLQLCICSDPAMRCQRM